MMEQMQMEQKKMKQQTQHLLKEKPNNTGIPAQMKHSFESRSGLSFDDVRVHYQSSRPAKIHALAYTQGSDVYIGPGQEQYLQHELGHVVQQKQGRVFPTRMRGGYAFNTSAQLEREADTGSFPHIPVTSSEAVVHSSSAPIQGMIDISYDPGKRTWEVEGTERPQFSKEVKSFFIKKGLQSINHIISSKDISTILAASIKLELNNHYLIPYDYREEPKGNGSNVRRLIKAVMPREENLVSPVEDRKREYMERAYKQRAEALQLGDVLDSFFGADNAQINTAHLKAVANGLESILFNSFGNLRVGDASVNKGIQSRLDPLIDTYTLDIDSDGRTPLVIFDEKATDNPDKTIRKRGMAKRVHKLARISDDFKRRELPVNIHMPRVVMGKDNHRVEVYSSDGRKEDFPPNMRTLPSTVGVYHYKSGTKELVVTKITEDINSTIATVENACLNMEGITDQYMRNGILDSILGSILGEMNFDDEALSDQDLQNAIVADLARELMRQAAINRIYIQSADDIEINGPLYCTLQSIIIRDIRSYNLNSGKEGNYSQERNYSQELYNGVIEYLEHHPNRDVDQNQYERLKEKIKVMLESVCVANIDKLEIAESYFHYFQWYINEFMVNYASEEHAADVREEIIDSVYDKVARRYVSYIIDVWNQMFLQELDGRGRLSIEVFNRLNEVNIKPFENPLFEEILSQLNTGIEESSIKKEEIVSEGMWQAIGRYIWDEDHYKSYVSYMLKYLGFTQ